MRLSIKYFLLICTMCLSTIDVCAQAGKAIIKPPKIPKIKPHRVKPPINWAAPVVHGVRKAMRPRLRQVLLRLKIPNCPMFG